MSLAYNYVNHFKTLLCGQLFQEFAHRNETLWLCYWRPYLLFDLTISLHTFCLALLLAFVPSLWLDDQFRAFCLAKLLALIMYAFCLAELLALITPMPSVWLSY